MQASEGGVKEKLFNQAFKVGIEVDRLKQKGFLSDDGQLVVDLARPVSRAFRLTIV